MIFLDRLSSFVWGNGLIFLLLLTGLIYTIRLKFVQFRLFPFILSRKKSSNAGLSQWKTVCLSLGTAMGTGNITGVAAALASGGAGAIFWMWISAFFGMALVYAENSLSVKYSNSECRGPMAYLSIGLSCRILAVIFAFFCLFAAFGMGGMVQVNSFADSLQRCININKYICASIIFALIYLVVKGGASRIGSAAQALLPAATILYSIICLAVLIKFRRNIPNAFGKIIGEAFGFRQAAGGISGFAVSKAVSTGIRRGIFSNEAGLGSSPILHSAAESDSSFTQGMWSMFEVFFDTIVCCTLTAVTILCASPKFSVHEAFGSVLGSRSSIFLSAEMSVFAFCTIIGWYYCGETAFKYITKSSCTKLLPVIFAAISSLGAVFTLKTVWTLSDIFNGLMAIPNLLGLLLLINKVRKE